MQWRRQWHPHSSTLAWKIPWTEEPGRLQSMGSLRVGHDWATSLSLFTFMHWRRKWQPSPVFLAWRIPGTGSLMGCRLWGHTVGHDWSDLAAAAAPAFHVLRLNLEAVLVSLHALSSHILQILLTPPLRYIPNSTTLNQLHHYHPGPDSSPVVLSHFGCVRRYATLSTVAHQAPPSKGNL